MAYDSVRRFNRSPSDLAPEALDQKSGPSAPARWRQDDDKSKIPGPIPADFGWAKDDAQSLLADLSLHRFRLRKAGNAGGFSRHEGRGRLGRRVHRVLFDPSGGRRVSLHSARIWDEGDVLNLGYMCEVVHRHGMLGGHSCGTATATRTRSNPSSRGSPRRGCPLGFPRNVYGAKWTRSTSRP